MTSLTAYVSSEYGLTLPAPTSPYSGAMIVLYWGGLRSPPFLVAGCLIGQFVRRRTDHAHYGFNIRH